MPAVNPANNSRNSAGACLVNQWHLN